MTHPPYPGPSEPAQPLGWGPPQPPPPSMVPTKPGRGLPLAAALIAVVWTVYEVVHTVFAYAAQDDYLNAADRGEAAWEVWTAYDLISIVWPFISIAAYVVVCLWLYQIRSHLDVVRPDAQHARRKGWVWAGWLVPIVSFWFPFQIVRDILTALRASSSGMLLGWWWAFWLLTLITQQIGPRLVGADEVNVDWIPDLGNFEALNAVLAVAALVCWLLLIRRIVNALDATEPA